MPGSEPESLPIRVNQVRLPATLARRNYPELTASVLRSRSPLFRAMEKELQAVRPGPAKPKIVSTAHGRIKSVLLTYPAYAADEYSYRAVYTDLLKKLPSATRFIILTHPSVLSDLRAALDDARATSRTTIIESPEFLQFLVWAEDPYVVVKDLAASPAITYFIEPFTFRRVADAVIADLVADATPIQSIQSPLYFQGGNVLIGDDFVLIGADYPANTLALVDQTGHIRVPAGTDTATFLKELYQKSFDPKRKVIYVGTMLPVPQYERRPVTIGDEQWEEEIYFGTGQAQPIFHIDMFISLAGRGPSGKYRLLVGSPRLADEILDRAPIPHAMGAIFDDVERNLRDQGFEILRNPLPLTYVDDPVGKLRTWYFATANNCLVQIDGKNQTVWLPTYGHGPWSDLRAVDDQNKEIWRRLRFTVKELADFHPFAQNLGAVHCIKKYLDR